MALALIVLALGSIAAGFIGVPHALGGHNVLHAWLEPSFAAPAVAGAAVAEAAEETQGAEAAHDETALELSLMAVSTGIALAGSFIGLFIWTKRRQLAASMARSFSGPHRVLLNKYYVDELYDRAIVGPIRAVSEHGLWKADVKIVDGAVNGVAAIVDTGALVLRRLQSGSVRTYAGSVIVGVVVILGYYIWR